LPAAARQTGRCEAPISGHLTSQQRSFELLCSAPRYDSSPQGGEDSYMRLSSHPFESL